jgi:hypothetical protein
LSSRPVVIQQLADNERQYIIGVLWRRLRTWLVGGFSVLTLISLIGLVIGLAKAYTEGMDRVESILTEKIVKEFETPRIKETVGEVAQQRAEKMLASEINPEVERFRSQVEGKVAQLRTLSKPLAELLFTLSARAGRWSSGIPRRDRYRMMEELESELRKIGLGDAEIETAKQDWHRFNLYDLSEPVFDPILARIETKRIERNQRTDKLSYPRVVDIEVYNLEVKHLWHISAEAKRLEMTRSLDNVDSVYRGLMSFLDTTDVFTDDEKRQVLADIKEELEDLRYYSENKKFRRLEHWMQSEKTE